MDITTFIENELDEILSPLFTTEWGVRSSIAALLLSAVMLLMIIIFVGVDWRDNIKALSPLKTTFSAPTNDALLWVAELPNLHLFGKYGVIEKSAVLPLTSLQLLLTGIITATPDSLSRVIISEGGRPGKVYQVGDTLESGVRVQAITEEGAVLENGGQLEKLPLRRLPGSNQTAKPPVPDVLDNNDEP